MQRLVPRDWNISALGVCQSMWYTILLLQDTRTWTHAVYHMTQPTLAWRTLDWWPCFWKLRHANTIYDPVPTMKEQALGSDMYSMALLHGINSWISSGLRHRKIAWHPLRPPRNGSLGSCISLAVLMLWVITWRMHAVWQTKQPNHLHLFRGRTPVQFSTESCTRLKPNSSAKFLTCPKWGWCFRLRAFSITSETKPMSRAHRIVRGRSIPSSQLSPCRLAIPHHGGQGGLAHACATSRMLRRSLMRWSLTSAIQIAGASTCPLLINCDQTLSSCLTGSPCAKAAASATSGLASMQIKVSKPMSVDATLQPMNPLKSSTAFRSGVSAIERGLLTNLPSIATGTKMLPESMVTHCQIHHTSPLRRWSVMKCSKCTSIFPWSSVVANHTVSWPFTFSLKVITKCLSSRGWILVRHSMGNQAEYLSPMGWTAPRAGTFGPEAASQ